MQRPRRRTARARCAIFLCPLRCTVPAPSRGRPDRGSGVPCVARRPGRIRAARWVGLPDRDPRRIGTVGSCCGCTASASSPVSCARDHRRLRQWLIAHGYAWGASSFSSTSLIPGTAADETAALWDHFVAEHGRPKWTYAVGASMGGWAAAIVAERYGNRFDGALGMCGAVGSVPALADRCRLLRRGGVRRRRHAGGVRRGDRHRAADRRPHPTRARRSGGARPLRRHHDRSHGRAPRVRPRRSRSGSRYQLAPGAAARRRAHRAPTDSAVPARTRERRHERAVQSTSHSAHDRRRSVPDVRRRDRGHRQAGRCRCSRCTRPATGRCRSTRPRSCAPGSPRPASPTRLAQRVFKDPGHCGFSTPEQEAATAALVQWVEQGKRPATTDLGVSDLRKVAPTFELAPRRADAAAGDTVTFRGNARLDGKPFDAQFLGAVVVDDNLVTPCNVTIPTIIGGRFSIGVYGAQSSVGLRPARRAGGAVDLRRFAEVVRDQRARLAHDNDGRRLRGFLDRESFRCVTDACSSCRARCIAPTVHAYRPARASRRSSARRGAALRRSEAACSSATSCTSSVPSRFRDVAAARRSASRSTVHRWSRRSPTAGTRRTSSI